MVVQKNIDEILFNLENNVEMQTLVSNMNPMNVYETYDNIMSSLEWDYHKMEDEKKELVRKNFVLFLKTANDFAVEDIINNRLLPSMVNGIEDWQLNFVSQELQDLINEINQ